MTKIRMGMVGGGEGAFIGAVHRMAAALDGEIELVCGAFSSDPERCARTGVAAARVRRRPIVTRSMWVPLVESEGPA